MANVKQELYQYFAQRHFNDMPPEVMERFKGYIATNDFQGNMRHWPKELMNVSASGAYTPKPMPNFVTSFTFDDWEKLYDWFQETLQKIYEDDKDGKFVHDDTIHNFINKWFGDGKIFRFSEAASDTDRALNSLYLFLNNPSNATKLRPIFQTNLSYVFDADMDYKKFCDKLGKKDYNTDLKFRSKVNQVVDYIAAYGPNSAMIPDQTRWPLNVGYAIVGGATPTITLSTPFNGDFDTQNASSWINEDPKKRFEIKNKGFLNAQFRHSYSTLLNTLVEDATIRKKFGEYDSTDISKQLSKALEFTSYDDKNSKSFVSPKPHDEKNWLDEIKKWKDDKYEDHLKKFFEPGYGSRIYYSPYAQTIAKALDKVGVKPADGIAGIIDKKDAILKEINKTESGTAKTHFEWFVEIMQKLSTSIPKAYAEALKNPKQMRDVVSQIIIEALKNKPYKIKQAKTAMEILSVAKYGMLTSKAINAVNEGLKDAKLFSDDKLSWNKNEGVKMVTNAIDATAKFGIKTATVVGTGLYNLIRRRSNKFGADVTKDTDLNNAYKSWKNRDASDLAQAKRSAPRELRLLSLGVGASTTRINVTNAATLRAGLPVPPTPMTPADKKLKQDLDRFDHLQNLLSANPGTVEKEWRKDKENTDHFHELIRYWDMLESFTKTHSFRLGSINVKRKAFLAGFGTKTKSQAEIDADTFANQITNITTR